jgi:predicted ribosomally synthesized peptide with SipW-like signal peptide
MKRDLIIIILLIASLGCAGYTISYYSDVETSANNNVEAGTLDLSIEDATTSVSLGFSNMQPYERKAEYLKVRNVGTLPFSLTANFNKTNEEEGLGGGNVSEILQSEIFVERDLLYYLYKIRDAQSDQEKNIWINNFINKVNYLKDKGLISEILAEELKTKVGFFVPSP